MFKKNCIIFVNKLNNNNMILSLKLSDAEIKELRRRWAQYEKDHNTKVQWRWFAKTQLMGDSNKV